MRRLSRLHRSIKQMQFRLARPQLPFLCSACLIRAPFSTSVRYFAEPQKLPGTERIRRRIWGTDQPPGFKDPYAGPTTAEEGQLAKEREAGEPLEEPKSKKEEVAQEPTPRRARKPAPVIDGSYEPARTWDGLEEVGELPPPQFYFKGYMPVEKVVDPYQATVALHRAVVEAFVLRQNGRLVSELSNADTVLDETVDVEISVSRSNRSAPLLTFPEGSSAEAVMASLRRTNPDLEGEEAAEAVQSDALKAEEAMEAMQSNNLEDDVFEPEDSGDASIIDSDTTGDAATTEQLSELVGELPHLLDYQKMVASWKSGWLQISLEDTEIKFAIVKRVMQLTGIRVSDSALSSAGTVRSLLTHIIKKPKAAKLFDALTEREDLVTLPNVKIFNRRITPIDKEKAVGRWKIIEKELTSRGLPVTGHAS